MTEKAKYDHSLDKTRMVKQIRAYSAVGLVELASKMSSQSYNAVELGECGDSADMMLNQAKTSHPTWSVALIAGSVLLATLAVVGVALTTNWDADSSLSDSFFVQSEASEDTQFKKSKKETKTCAYRYYRFVTVKTRGFVVQLAELQLFFQNIWQRSVDVDGNCQDELCPPNEEGSEANDNNPNTKWLNFIGLPLVYDFGEQAKMDEYNWMTANDNPSRDVLRWKLEGSDDKVNWKTLDDRSRKTQDVSRDRYSWTAPGAARYSGYPLSCKECCSSEFLPGLSFETPNVAEYKLETPEQCREKCNGHPDCVAWTSFPEKYDEWQYNCFLRGEITGYTEIPDTVSGLNCAGKRLMPGFSFETEKVAQHSVPTPGECRSLCEKEPECAAFTSFPDKYVEWQFNCFLRSAVGEYTANPDAVSGLPCPSDAGKDKKDADDGSDADLEGFCLYRYYRFTPELTRGAFLQLAELQLFDGDEWTPAVEVNGNCGCPDGEEGENANDDNRFTKWLNYESLPLVYDFGEPTQFDEYNWMTANDAPERDPIRWKLQGSNDGVHWKTVDDRSRADQEVSTDRYAWTAEGANRFAGYSLPTCSDNAGKVADNAVDGHDFDDITILRVPATRAEMVGENNTDWD
eukprot:g57220.t1